MGVKVVDHAAARPAAKLPSPFTSRKGDPAGQRRGQCAGAAGVELVIMIRDILRRYAAVVIHIIMIGGICQPLAEAISLQSLTGFPPLDGQSVGNSELKLSKL